MRISFAGLAWLAVAVAFVGPATAQHETVLTLFDLFAADGVDPAPAKLDRLTDEVRRTQVPEGCPLGILSVFAGEGDPLFQEALAAARRDALLQLLEARGLNVAGRLFADAIVFGSEADPIDTHYEAGHDDDAPRLRTTSVPHKGSRVDPGDTITVTMTATDGTERWQTGVKTVQLVADSDGGAFVASENFPPCSEPREKRVQATYTVPANPPPVVRLTALAEDHAGLIDTDTAEFPTGDWYGTLEWSFDHHVEATADSSGVEAKRTGSADLVLRQSRDGTVEGTLVGAQTYENWWGYAGNSQFCRWESPGPQPVHATLDGMYEQTRGHPMFAASDVQAIIHEELVEAVKCTSPPTEADFGFEFQSMLPMLVHQLTRVDDTTFTVRFPIENVGDRDWLRGHYTLTLRRAAG